MHLGDIIDAVSAHLAASLPVPLPAIGSDAGATLPAVVLSVSGGDQPTPGIGGAPRTLAHGALAITVEIDLADPVLVFPDETVPLLAGDRRALQLPHAPLVDLDGGMITPLSGADLAVALDGVPFAVVASAPVAGQVQPERIAGRLRFFAPLPASGIIAATYRVGEWAVETGRFTGVLDLAVRAADVTATATLGRRVAAALTRSRARRIPGLLDLAATAFGPVTAAVAPATGFVQQLAWRFAVEREEPVVSTGGGPIRRIHVHSGTGPEDFDLT